MIDIMAKLTSFLKDERADINTNISNFCERCAFSINPRITLSKENGGEEDTLEIITYDNQSEDYGVSSNLHTMPDGDFIASGMTRTIDPIRLQGVKIGDTQYARNIFEETAIKIDYGVDLAFSWLGLMGADLYEINDKMSKGQRAIYSYYNTAKTTITAIKQVKSAVVGSEKNTTDFHVKLLNAWANTDNRKFNLYFNGIKYKNLALSFSRNSYNTEVGTYDITFTYCPTTDVEPSTSSVKLPFIKGLTGPKEKLTAQAEEATTFIKSLMDNIKLF